MTKKTGFDFWTNVLGSPRYVVAPMVDMSELSYRLLCRQYGAQLCYSPMFHSQQFLQDSLYRSDVFSTSSEDTPLIVQFCANNPETFVSAASIISSQCVAVDLNLGCPQAIARKGNYGAFLQDDWNLINSIVQKAASELPVPVTCKMRILPGDIKQSIEYAKMLENSGCSVLAIHGRTREQKGHATGLASWDVIKEIKANVKIPVIANGNILSFNDVEECLEYTGADAVMSAEALLHNPALFSGKNPPVWKIVEEYLNMAEKCKTHIRHVRCHLFKILYLCIYQNDELNHLLTEGSTYCDFHKICDVLRELPSQEAGTQSYETNCLINEFDLDNSESDCSSDSISLESWLENSVYAENSDNSFTNLEDKNCMSNNSHETLIELMHFEEAQNMQTPSSNANDVDCEDQNYFVKDEQIMTESIQSTIVREHLPVWLCHSRPRIVMEDTNRGCYSKYFQASSTKCFERVDASGISKKKIRKARRHARVLESMKEKRKLKKLRKKQKSAELKETHTNETKPVETSVVKITKKQRKLMIRQRMLNARGVAPKVAIDLSFTSEMETKEINRLSSQLRRVYGSNRHSEKPLHLYFCSLKPRDPLYEVCKTKNDGFTEYVVEMTEERAEDIFPTENIVYLSPDSENILESLEQDKVYIIGGLVDGSVKKGLTLNQARYRKVHTAQLPIDKHLVRCSQNPGTPVLTVNQVFDILLSFHETGNWTSSLTCNIPQRKGFCSAEDAVIIPKVQAEDIVSTAEQIKNIVTL